MSDIGFRLDDIELIFTEFAILILIQFFLILFVQVPSLFLFQYATQIATVRGKFII